MEGYRTAMDTTIKAIEIVLNFLKQDTIQYNLNDNISS